jgi:ABC-type arginine transport system ATPase subunit
MVEFIKEAVSAGISKKETKQKEKQILKRLIRKVLQFTYRVPIHLLNSKTHRVVPSLCLILHHVEMMT